MCGIFGFYEPSRPAAERTALGLRLAERMRARGPDDAGAWSDESGLTLAHRRLSIVDLSASAHQPMRSSTGRFVISFNGEVYNFPELRAELEQLGSRFVSTSDTEVILEAVEHWGVPRAVERLVGMFAIALWDATLRKLHLVRDRFGEKPLYYGWNNDLFFFASELKPITAHPSWSGSISRSALRQYFRFGAVPSPHCIYEGLRKLRPGHRVELDLTSKSQDDDPVAYWDFLGMVRAREGARRRRVSESDVLAELETHLQRAVRRQMVADVPLGAFLSGGVDSSCIVALMQSQSSRPVRTFTIGFEEKDYDESPFAKAIATHLGTDHTELIVTIDRARDLVPSLHEIYDEPFADSSQLPTTLVAQLARRHVTVSLSGDGGDELFGGYTRYRWAERIWQGNASLPAPVRSALGGAVRSIPVASWQQVYEAVAGAIPTRLRVRGFGQKVHTAAMWFSSRSPMDLYLWFLLHWQEELIRGGSSVPDPEVFEKLRAIELSFREKMMVTDSLQYLPDDILTKVDRATMSASLESRAPFLDHELAEFLWTVPASIRFDRKTPKVLLQKTLERYVPRTLFDRPKAGFGVPIGRWLRTELKPWAEHLLGDVMTKRCPYIDHALVGRRWDEHVSGARDWHGLLWDLLMFLSWLDNHPGLDVGPALPTESPDAHRRVA